MTIPVRFARKPISIDDVHAACRDRHAAVYYADIVERRQLNTADYDQFTSSFLDDRSWLTGKGGWTDHRTRRVIALSAPDRPTLYVDPSGYSYARYVGLALPAATEPTHTPAPWRTVNETGMPEIRAGEVSIADIRLNGHNMERGEANARRIVAAVNACEGITTIALEDGAVHQMQAALQIASNYMSDDLDEDDESEIRVLHAIRAASGQVTHETPATANRTLAIEVLGGVVQGVSNLPPGWDYEVIDHDNTGQTD